MYAQVVFSIASFKSFTYQVPKDIEKNITTGIAVYAPFKNQLHLGYVVSVNSKSNYKGKIYSMKLYMISIKQRKHTLTKHNHSRNDPYFWMNKTAKI